MLEKDKQKYILNLTLDRVENDGIEDPDLDEMIVIYDITKNGIETVMGFQIEFEKLIKMI